MTTALITPEQILAKPYARRLTPEIGGGYGATIQEFPGLIAEGDTPDEALANLEAAALSWLEVSLAHSGEIREPISFEGCSGKIALRIPRALHCQVAELAETEGCGLNQWLTAAIAAYATGTPLRQKPLAVRRQAASKADAGADNIPRPT
jgi:antitoxin HicB